MLRWHGRSGERRHPRDKGAAEVEAFLNILANERKVSAYTHNQALSAFFVSLPRSAGHWSALFQFLESDLSLLALLLCGTGTLWVDPVSGVERSCHLLQEQLQCAI